MNIEQEETGNTGRFYVKENNITLAEMLYTKYGANILLVTHTEVDESLEGKGIGKLLVAAAVEYARNNSFIIMATCPFAKKVLERTKEYADVYTAYQH